MGKENLMDRVNPAIIALLNNLHANRDHLESCRQSVEARSKDPRFKAIRKKVLAVNRNVDELVALIVDQFPEEAMIVGDAWGGRSLISKRSNRQHDSKNYNNYNKEGEG